jgi:succinate dehydrogenase hydrophobic anchor subunit
MRDYTRMEKLKITAGALTAVVIVGWLAVFAFALLSTP